MGTSAGDRQPGPSARKGTAAAAAARGTRIADFDAKSFNEKKETMHSRMGTDIWGEVRGQWLPPMPVANARRHHLPITGRDRLDASQPTEEQIRRERQEPRRSDDFPQTVGGRISELSSDDELCKREPRRPRYFSQIQFATTPSRRIAQLFPEGVAHLDHSRFSKKSKLR